jgi:hypothetical protein
VLGPIATAGAHDSGGRTGALSGGSGSAFAGTGASQRRVAFYGSDGVGGTSVAVDETTRSTLDSHATGSTVSQPSVVMASMFSRPTVLLPPVTDAPPALLLRVLPDLPMSSESLPAAASATAGGARGGRGAGAGRGVLKSSMSSGSVGGVATAKGATSKRMQLSPAVTDVEAARSRRGARR